MKIRSFLPLSPYCVCVCVQVCLTQHMYIFFSLWCFFSFFLFSCGHTVRKVAVCLPTQGVASRNINESKTPPHFMCQKRSSTHTRHVSYTHLHALLALTMLTRTFLDTQQQVSATPSSTSSRPPPGRDQPVRRRPTAARQHRLRRPVAVARSFLQAACQCRDKGARACVLAIGRAFIGNIEEVDLILFLCWSISQNKR